MAILEWWGIKGVRHNCCGKFIVEWGGLLRFKNRKKLWSLFLGCVLWSLWYQRNRVKFEASTPNFYNTIYNLKSRITIRVKDLLGFDMVSPHDFIHNLNAVIL